MNIKDYIKLSFVSFRRNLTRTMLTGLGIVISIASVIIVISAAQGVKGLIIGQFDAFGSNLLQTETRVPSTGKPSSAQSHQAQALGTVITTLTLDDMTAIRRLPNIVTNYAGQISQAVATSPTAKKTVMVYGVSPTYLDIDTGQIAGGRFFTAAEDNSLARVVALGSEVATDLFGNVDPIGQVIKLKNKNYEVIGTFESRGASLFFNFDTVVYIPIQTLQKQLLGVDYISAITSQYRDQAQLAATIASVEDLLRARHQLDSNEPDQDDFMVQSNQDVTNTLDTIIGGLTVLLVALALISLVVGGVGIMNIMYVSVLERTFEIGLRKAVGARSKEILRQFLTEAVLVTIMGGIVGVTGGVLVSYLISVVAFSQGFNWVFAVPLYSIFLATGISFVCGLVFGLYPARQAANLDPIEALRKE
ncbi:MAG: ABC transporter permease [Patescibacteria group bacterium]